MSNTDMYAALSIDVDGDRGDRDRFSFKHFEPWVAFAKKHGFGIDMNPTCFGHTMVKDGLTLSSPIGAGYHRRQ